MKKFWSSLSLDHRKDPAPLCLGNGVRVHTNIIGHGPGLWLHRAVAFLR